MMPPSSVSIFPFITKSEFEDAGKTLVQGCSAEFHPNDWIRVEWTGRELQVCQRRSVVSEASKSQAKRVGNDDDWNSDHIEEGHDEELFDRRQANPSFDRSVNYSIVLSPTYQVPVLWFTSSSISTTAADALEQVYEQIVSPVSRMELRQIGVLGGISMAEHPVNDLPAFFIHPCRTPEALEAVRPQKNITPVEYVMLWLGIMGSAVGLSVPSDVAKSLLIQEANR